MGSEQVAFGYLRVSGRGQVDGDGPERQELAIREYAAKNGLAVEQIFFDAGVSGKTAWGDRHGWVAMMAAIRVSGVRTIIVEKLDRLSRNFGLQEYVIEDLRKTGVSLISVAEPDLDEQDPTRVLFRQIMGSIAQYDRAMLTLKMQAAKDRKRARGERAEVDYAYGQHPHRPEERSTLTTMRELYSCGRSYHAVSVELNARGLKPRRGPKWHYATVQRILQRAS